MEKNHYLMLNNSILYRCSSKFCDKELAKYDLGVTPLLVCIAIHENEGIVMKDLVQFGSFDKGTITKVLQKLQDQGYVEIKENPDNRRERQLYTTDALKAIIGDIYLKRQAWWELLMQGMSSEEIDQFQVLIEKVAENARRYAEDTPSKIKIFGLQKLTLLDFPGETGATVFLGGCNFRCPYCHNSELVFLSEDSIQIPNQDVMDYLEKRKGMLDGVCISGGEPLLQEGVEEFLTQVKALGYKTKIDTNGTSPDVLKSLVKKGLVDYVAMDLKNSKEKYGETIGVPSFDISNIEKSVKYLLKGEVDYEFRTTVVKEFHEEKDFEAMGKWIKGAKKYVLQRFEDKETCIQRGLHSPSEDDLKKYKEIMESYVDDVRVKE